VPRVLLLLPTTTYRAADFLEAARRLDLSVTVASEEPSALESIHPEGLWALDLKDPDAAARRAVELARETPIHAVVGVDEETAVAAAAIARALSLPQNSVEAAAAARHKGALREKLARAGVPSPPHRLYSIPKGPARPCREASYPCVLKPTFLAASRGVIRADDEREFRDAWERISRLLRDPEVVRRGGSAANQILVEEYVPGPEVALEGLLTKGRLRVLALFDKPDPLEGPFFEETIYITPSRLPPAVQDRIGRVAADGARALGLEDGPIHAELRVPGGQPVVLEIAARSIGGLCSRTLRFGTGVSLEELVLRHALGWPVELERESGAAGVMMIPIPRAGILEEIRGLDEARAVPGIQDVTITIRPGQRLVPLPEGWRYLGFVFSRGDSPEQAEASLRQAHGLLEIRIRS
jgi:biotin carboxylase